MSNSVTFGSKLRHIRKSQKKSLSDVAKAIGVDRSTLNRVELDEYAPKIELLNKLFSYFSLEGNEKAELLNLAGIGVATSSSFAGKEKRVKEQQAKIQNMNVKLNADKVTIQYTDMVLVSSSENGLVLDVAQSIGGNMGQLNVVSRVGMTFEHAKRLVSAITDNIEKHER